MNIATLDTVQDIIKQLELLIESTTEDKDEYYADGNSTDTYVMSLVGQIDGYKKAIVLIKTNFMKGN